MADKTSDGMANDLSGPGQPKGDLMAVVSCDSLKAKVNTEVSLRCQDAAVEHEVGLNRLNAEFRVPVGNDPKTKAIVRACESGNLGACEVNVVKKPTMER